MGVYYHNGFVLFFIGGSWEEYLKYEWQTQTLLQHFSCKSWVLNWQLPSLRSWRSFRESEWLFCCVFFASFHCAKRWFAHDCPPTSIQTRAESTSTINPLFIRQFIIKTTSFYNYLDWKLMFSLNTCTDTKEYLFIY